MKYAFPMQSILAALAIGCLILGIFSFAYADHTDSGGCWSVSDKDCDGVTSDGPNFALNGDYIGDRYDVDDGDESVG